jgi:hypothetical protein
LVFLVAHVELAWVLAGDERGEDGGDLLDHVALSQNGWTAELEGRGDVAVDVGDDLTVAY